MIITRTPFRISFVGGGSDLPSFYKRTPGAVLSTTINKYVYLSIHPYYNRRQTSLKYSKTELCDSIDKIEHPIIRETLKYTKVEGGCEITSTADIPAGTGLGSSSSFTVSLLHLLHAYKSEFTSKEQLASEACIIEIEKLKEPIGKQDQYAAAYGGLNVITFNSDETVNVEPLMMKPSLLDELQQNIIIFYTKQVRSTSNVLRKQAYEVTTDNDKFEDQKKIVNLVYETRDCLVSGDLMGFGEQLHKGWMLKKSLSDGISNAYIDKHYRIAIENGAVGGKVLGAGGGGFLLFYCEKEKRDSVRKALSDMYELKFGFDSQGSKIIYVSESSLNDESGFFE